MAGNREYKSDVFGMLMEEPELELTCMVYNINSGKNRELLPECPVLEQYMTFVGYVREYLGKYPEKDLRKVIDKAIEKCSPKGLHFCIEEGVLQEFLTKRREEVTKVTQLDYTFDRRIELEREDAREEARAEERVNTERERKRAELAEIEVQKLREQLEYYKSIIKAGFRKIGKVQAKSTDIQFEPLDAGSG